jgi:hypothetical protein
VLLARVRQQRIFKKLSAGGADQRTNDFEKVAFVDLVDLLDYYFSLLTFSF